MQSILHKYSKEANARYTPLPHPATGFLADTAEGVWLHQAHRKYRDSRWEFKILIMKEVA